MMKKISIIISLLFLAGCGATEKSTTVLKDIFSSPADYVGKEITYRFEVLGWNGSGCEFAENSLRAPITKSDWLVKADGYCAYVTGGKPDFLNFFNLQGGEEINLTCIDKMDENNKIFLEYFNGTKISK